MPSRLRADSARVFRSLADVVRQSESSQEVYAAICVAATLTVPGCDHFSAIPHALTKAAVFDFLDGLLDDDFPAFE